jgi:hypothetical protein
MRVLRPPLVISRSMCSIPENVTFVPVPLKPSAAVPTVVVPTA